ncbi:MAG: hypothetical protein RIN56_03005 [Sporomusaceae bacterium]|nr:hypothetical protein [Sporomusaceae bacterium]
MPRCLCIAILACLLFLSAPVLAADSAGSGKPLVAVDFWSNLDRAREDAEKAVFSLVDREKYRIADTGRLLADEKAHFGEAGPLASRDKAAVIDFGQKYGYDYILAAHFRQDVEYVFHKDAPYYIDRLSVRIRIIDVRNGRILHADSFVVSDADKFYKREDLVKRVVDEAIFRIENVQCLN